MSIWDNVAAGLKLNGVKDKNILNEIIEDSLKMAYLWDEVKDELKKPPVALSGGQLDKGSVLPKPTLLQPEVLSWMSLHQHKIRCYKIDKQSLN